MTSIEWTAGDDGAEGSVWNPTTGCDRISPGCDHCYALTMAKRLKGMGQAKYQRDGDPRTSGPGFGLAAHPDTLDLPLHWRKPRRVFVNSMSDLFHADVPATFIGSVFDMMALTPRHTYQILTKRPARMRALLTRWQGQAEGRPHAGASFRRYDMLWSEPRVWPLPNVWLGVSAEDQHWADVRIPALLDTPAAVRFVSAEPLLGPIELPGELREGRMPQAPDWLIIGGESGPGARPMELEWARDLLAQCRCLGTAPFVKQLGSVLGRKLGAGSKGNHWDAFPDDLKIREFPRTAEAVPA